MAGREDGGSTETIAIDVVVNRTQRSLKVTATSSLLEVLRGDLGLVGAREGCGIGMCGACTVLVDGRAISSCLMLAPMADGAEIKTIEGLASEDETLHPMQQAFADHTAFQCSYCTPGFILAAIAMLDRDPGLTDELIVEELSGNLCRCGSYGQIRAAVSAARRAGESAT